MYSSKSFHHICGCTNFLVIIEYVICMVSENDTVLHHFSISLHILWHSQKLLDPQLRWKGNIYILSWNSKGHLVSQGHRKIDSGPQSSADLIADNALLDYKILTVMVLGTYDMHIYILY